VISPGEKLNLQFRVKAVQGGVAKEVAFAELLTRPAVVSVHMKNNTPRCDRQNESFSARAADFERAGYQVIAVSRDTGGSHARYARSRGLPFTLVSDPGYAFARATQSLVEKSLYGRKYLGPERAAYVIDRDGTVLAVATDLEAKDPAAQVLALIRDVRAG
jgi:peroxiredoxin Q/BCP